MMKNIKKLLSSKKGESLIESLLSIMIFSLLIVTVTLTIATALRITANATQDAHAMQTQVNQIIAGATLTGDDTVILTARFVNAAGSYIPGIDPLVATHIVEINNQSGRLAFRPTQPEP